ncbi:MAG: FtsX-like permease family protein [Gemmatimonas sp.]|nr:FtsX-like permease family protein [Gemmatimonas sp.]
MRERFPGLRRILRVGLWRKELDDELAFHHGATVEELMESGLSREAAEAEANSRFGSRAGYRRAIERIDRRAAIAQAWEHRLDVTAASIKYAVRRLRRAPVFSVGIILTFALGIGANATMFSIIDRLFLTPPPHIAEPETIRRVLIHGSIGRGALAETHEIGNYPDILDLSRATGIKDLTMVGPTIELGDPGLNQGIGQLVAGDFFEFLGVRPSLGRFFGPEDDQIGGSAVAVISDHLWRTWFGGADDVIGQTLDFGDGPYRVVGVAPPGFSGADLAPIDVWVPLRLTWARMQGPECFDGRRGCGGMSAIVRIDPAYSDAQVESQAWAAILAGREAAGSRGPFQDDSRAVVTPLLTARGPQASQESKVAIWLAGISLVVLLIACSNIANLIIARLSRERRESAVRLAIGSSRRRLAGQVVLESLILSMIGAVAGYFIAQWGGTALRTLLLPELGWEVPGLARRTVYFTLLAATFAGLLAALVPAAHFSRSSVGEALKSGGRTMAMPIARMRSTLTAVQAGLSVLLLVGAGLFVRSVQNVQTVDLGVEPEGLLAVAPIVEEEMSRQEEGRLIGQVMAELERLPSVEAASRDLSVPFALRAIVPAWTADGDSLPPGYEAGLHAVDPDYFGLSGLQLLRGRGLRPDDSATAPRVVVVSESLARLLWPSEDPLGDCLIMLLPPRDCMEVIGVVADSREAALDATQPINYYVPFEQRPAGPPGGVILIRTSTPASLITPDVRAVATSIRGVSRVEIIPVADLVDRQTRSWRLGASLFTIFGLLALIVAGVGLYSALAYGVAQRMFELGIRSALGARRKQLTALVFKEGLVLTGVGILAGLLAAYFLTPRIEDLLFEVSPRDPLTLAGVAITLLVVAGVACILPARRAARVDPGVVLRAE